MTTSTAFPYTGFCHHLEALVESGTVEGNQPFSPALGGLLFANGVDGELTAAVLPLIALLNAAQAMHAAALATAMVADALRRYQKFAKPGQPSPHIVQLRQQQGAARLASSQSRQRFNLAAAAFVREAAIKLPARLALEASITHWIELNLPADATAS